VSGAVEDGKRSKCHMGREDQPTKKEERTEWVRSVSGNSRNHDGREDRGKGETKVATKGRFEEKP